MRKFAVRLRVDGRRVDYVRLDDPENTGSIPGELLRAAERHGAGEVIATQPGEWRLIEALDDCPLPVRQLPDDRFVCSNEEFARWAGGRKTLRMEWFYREMRRKTGLLMDGDAPEGGAWNYDTENRRPPPDAVATAPMSFTPDDTVREVLTLVGERFPSNFGRLEGFNAATDRGQARRALAHFVRHALPRFGPFQDAMLDDDRYLYHAAISAYMNAGLLDPLEVCRAAEDAYHAGDAPLNSVEGFIRQIIGWREYMRGIYFLEGPDYPRRNVLNHERALPDAYWGGETRMRCIARTVEAIRDEAYAHHIQRLMVTGNFALLAGIDPREVHEWYLAVFWDAYEWVESPNVIGMSQFADGGIVASKPYVSSANYIVRMSDYCGRCHYSPSRKTGEGACPFNLLYWAFLDRHRARFERNTRMSRIYSNWDRMDEEKRRTILAEAEAFLDRMSAGEVV
jgi:deoxyribodipyrimidine photolyase-related protein